QQCQYPRRRQYSGLSGFRHHLGVTLRPAGHRSGLPGAQKIGRQGRVFQLQLRNKLLIRSVLPTSGPCNPPPLETLLVTQNVRFPPICAALAAAFGLMIAAQAADAQTTTTQTTQPAAPAAQPAPAQNIPVVIGILDTEAVVLGSNAGKSLTAQANAQLKAL